MSKKITTSKDEAVRLVREHRSEFDMEGAEYAGCLVVIVNGEVVGHNDFMRYALDTRTDTICVDVNDHVFMAVGSNEGWAHHWVVMD